MTKKTELQVEHWMQSNLDLDMSVTFIIYMGMVFIVCIMLILFVRAWNG